MYEKPTRHRDRKLLDEYHQKPCIVCRYPHSDPAHIIPRSRGGPDKKWNLLALCREHHTEQHTIGWDRFIHKHKLVCVFKNLGWEIDGNNYWPPEFWR